MNYADKMARLRDLGELQGEMAAKAKNYAAQDDQELALRFERASYAAVNARTFMHAALMAEREAKTRKGMQ
jgi:hypothetical protein